MLRRLRVSRVDAHVVIAGGAFLIDQLKRRAVELEISDRVHFLGETDDVRPVLAAMDVFVLPSIAVESFSNAALEAMSMGKPVILSEIGGAREMINDGVEGYVVSPTELAARLPAIISALYADRRKRLLMGRRRGRGRSPAFRCQPWWRAIAACFTESLANADLLEVERELPAQSVRTASTDFDSRMRVLQSAFVAVRGGISSVERLICDYLTLRVDPPCLDHGRDFRVQPDHGLRPRSGRCGARWRSIRSSAHPRHAAALRS
jgi:hypothetical protein